MARDAGVVGGNQLIRFHSPGFALHDHFPATQTRRVRRNPKLKRMKSKRNHPCAPERAKMFMVVGLADANVAGFFIDINFGVRRRNFFPFRIRPLWRDEVGQLWHRIENPHSSVRGEICRKETEMKIWAPESGARQRSSKRLFVWTSPIHAMMKKSRRRVKLGQDPLIIAAGDRFWRCPRQLEIG